jgi:hypothetical protein
VPHPLRDLFEISNLYTNCKEKKRKMKEEGIREKKENKGKKERENKKNRDKN